MLVLAVLVAMVVFKKIVLLVVRVSSVFCLLPSSCVWHGVWASVCGVGVVAVDCFLCLASYNKENKKKKQ